MAGTGTKRRTAKRRKQVRRRWMWGIALGTAALILWTHPVEAVQQSSSLQAAGTSVTQGANQTANQTSRGELTAGALAAATSRSQGLAVREVDFLRQTMAATGATPSEYLLNAWSRLNHTFSSEQKLMSAAKKLVQEMGVQNAKWSMQASSVEHYVLASGRLPSGGQVNIVLTSFAPSTSVEGTSAGELVDSSTVLVLTDENRAYSEANFVRDERRFEAALQSEGQPPQISSCLIGHLDAKIMGVHAENLAYHALHTVGAVPLQTFQSGGLETSISGYAPRQLTYIITDDHRMNLQVAVHYDGYQQDTNVLVGTPIITTTY
ncbi:MAG: YwmB family TATA-box binding protein [Alicyclobacillaceae bacterium]|nr:YwmB family TATA-box binding protein [Alicyclobacillaceae bacterium]